MGSESKDSGNGARDRDNDVAETIGWVFIAWSELESHVSSLLENIFLFRGVDEQLLEVSVANIDMRQKLNIIPPLLFHMVDDQAWLDAATKTLNSIGNDLRNRRNRIAHDAWIYTEKGLHRKENKPIRLDKVQSRTFEIARRPINEDPLEDIGFLARECIAAARAVSKIDRDLFERFKSGQLTLPQSYGTQPYHHQRRVARLRQHIREGLSWLRKSFRL